MKFTRNFLNKAVIAAYSAAVLFTLGVPAIAQARTQYQDTGTSTTPTPVFNEFYGVPNGVGDEADFVRLRPATSTNNADYISDLNAACNDGDGFTVRTYIHNGADPSQNNNGTGTAVAHNVVVAMQAPLNTTNSAFPFVSTVTASNAATVTDNAHLNCSKTVKLVLVPGSVKSYSSTLGFNAEPDSAVNGSLRVGSRVHGSGDQWGCWEDRIIVTYDVKVVVTPPVIEQPVCVSLVSKLSGRTLTISKVNYDAHGATVKNIRVDFGNGTVRDLKDSDFPYTYTYDKDAQYIVRATLLTDKGDITSNNCVTTISTTSIPPKTPPTTLVDTGAGDIVGIFAAVTVAGALVHRFVLSRRLS